MANKSKNHKGMYIKSSAQRQIWLSERFDTVKLKLTLEISESDYEAMSVGWPELPDSVVELIGQQGVMQGIYRGLIFDGSPSQTYLLKFKPQMSLSVPIEDLTDEELTELQFLVRDLAWQLTIRAQKRMLVSKH